MGGGPCNGYLNAILNLMWKSVGLDLVHIKRLVEQRNSARLFPGTKVREDAVIHLGPLRL